MNDAVSPEILVTGGTGALGRLVVPRLRAADRSVRVLSRRPQEAREGVEHVSIDLLDPKGLDTALDGIDTVLHLAGGPKGDDRATTNLMAAAARSAVRHVVLISVVGADAMPLGYFRAKAGAERAVAESGLPWTTVRVAQVDTLVLQMVEAMARLPFVVDPRGLRAQPVHPDEVADRLTELTLGSPAERVADLVGPEVHTLADLTRGYLRARGRRRRPTLPLRIPGKVGHAYRAGTNLSLEGATVANRPWRQFLAEVLGYDTVRV